MQSPPNWHSLIVFPIALGALAFVSLIACLSFCLCKACGSLKKPLEHLDASWSFSDSWATNITAAGALVAAILSSTDVLTTLFGQDAKGPVALATVGAAIGAAVAGAAPLVLGATKTKDNFDSVLGLLLASAVTLTGAFGEIFILWEASEELSLNGLGHSLVGVAAVLAVLLLCGYAGRSIPTTIKQGTKAPSDAPSDTVAAAKMIVAALKELSAGNENETARAISPHLQLIASRASAEHQRPRRSTLL